MLNTITIDDQVLQFISKEGIRNIDIRVAWATAFRSSIDERVLDRTLQRLRRAKKIRFTSEGWVRL
jgi:hypothetical protein